MGGLAGPPLDAGEDPAIIDPVGFAARMWRGALAMAELQAMEFGYQVELTGSEIADLAAFAATPSAQVGFSEAEIPEFGANDVFGLSWRDILGAYSCTECGRCRRLPLSSSACCRLRFHSDRYRRERGGGCQLTGQPPGDLDVAGQLL